MKSARSKGFVPALIVVAVAAVFALFQFATLGSAVDLHPVPLPSPTYVNGCIPISYGGDHNPGDPYGCY